MTPLWILTLLFLSLPARGSESTRLIDRPYTLRAHQQDVTLSSGIVYEREKRSNKKGHANYIVDARLRTRINKNTSIVYSPLLLGLQRRFQPTVKAEAGASWLLGFMQDFNYGLWPQFEGFYRTNTHDDVAWVHRVQYSVFIPFSKSPELGSISYEIGALKQINDFLALTTFVQTAINDLELRRIFVDKDGFSADSDAFKLVFPMGLKLNWSANNTLIAGLDYSFRGLGIQQRYQIHRTSFSVEYAW